MKSASYGFILRKFRIGDISKMIKQEAFIRLLLYPFIVYYVNPSEAAFVMNSSFLFLLKRRIQVV